MAIPDTRHDYQIPRLPNYQILPAALLLIGFAIIVAILAAGLRADAFFVGDPGVKLISARNAIAHPAQPLNIPLPIIDGESLPYVEPFFEAHADHAHAITADVFPLMSAPLIKWFGLRGAYILPALGFLGILAGCGWLAAALDSTRQPFVAVAIAALATPFLFYGLEFWEHAPAVAAATCATALIVKALGGGTRGRPAIALGSGLLFGLALLMRPEIGCVFIAVLVASRWLDEGGTTTPQRWTLTAFAVLGVALTLIPLETYTVLHFGRPIPSHLAANSGLLQTGWIAERIHLAREWLIPSGWTASGPIRTASFWSVAPVAVLAFVPLRHGTGRRGRRFLWTIVVLTVVLVLLTAPNDGGGQWGPRYLLFAYVPLVVLAADVVETLPRRTTNIVALFAFLLICLWVQRSAYRQLRGSKETYGRVVDFVANEVAPGGYLVTDLWWLDQVAAAATSERQLVYVPDLASGQAVMRRLNKAVVPVVSLIRSETESPDLTPWTEGTCYVEIHRHTLEVRNLVAIWLHHRCAS